jgi:3-oxoacyl-[acyl-carrier-protein] synthase II
MRRVVVSGLGAVTPLGVGARLSWSRVLAGHSGIVSVANSEPQKLWRSLPSTVAGVVPRSGIEEGCWRPDDWLTVAEQRRMSVFTQYAIVAATEALADAGWAPSKEEELEATGVCLGSGIGNLDDMYRTAVAFDQEVRTGHFSDSHDEVTQR